MADGPSGKGQDRSSLEIDTSVPNAARVYDYLLGGTDNFEVDRAAADANNAVLPGGIAAAQAEVRANRDFLGRAVRWLVDTAGIRQFLDIGTGIPNADNVHAIAQDAAPESRIVCVDYDPVVLAHAHTLLKSSPEGAAAFIHGDLREPGKILAQATATIDLDQPTALLMLGLLYLVPDEDDPHAIVRGLIDELAPGSYLVISHMTADFNPEMLQLAERLNETMAEPFIMRPRAEVERFFDGLELVPPGVVQVGAWQQGGAPAAEPGDITAYYVGVGRKP